MFGAAALVSGTITTPFTIRNGVVISSTWALTVTLGVVAIALSVAYIGLTLFGQGRRELEEQQPFETATAAPDVDAAFAAIVHSAYSQFEQTWRQNPGPDNQAVQHAYVFSQVIANPQAWISRITEWVEPYTATQKVTTNFTLVLPNGLAGRLVVPLLPMPRGTIVDGLKLSDSTGRLSSLTRVEGAAYACAVVRFLFSRTYKGALEDYDSSIALDVMRILLDQKQYRPDPSAEKPNEVRDADLRSVRERFVGLLRHVKRRDRINAENLVDVILYVISGMMDSDFVCVEVDLPSDESFVPRTVRLTAEKIVPKRQSLAARGRPITRVIFESGATLRRLLGIPTTIYQHELGLATLASSYHAHITGPEGTYLARQNISIRPGSRATSTPSTGTVVMQARTGQRESHLYVRDAGQTYSEAMFANRFYERPPGSVAAPLLSAFAALVVTALCAVKAVLLPDTTEPHVDLIAILLAFPTVIALWVGVSDGARPSLISYGSKGVTVVGSIVAAFLYTLGTDETPHLAAYWVLICGSLALNVLVCSGSLITRSAMHGKIISSRSKEEELSDG
jgi:hypothetical protein